MRSRSASVIAAHKDAPGSIAATKAAAQVAVPETQTTSSSEWLDAYNAELMRRDAAIRASISQKIEIDKRARALDVEWIEAYLRHRPRLIKELDKLGITEKALVPHPRTGLLVQHGDAAHSDIERPRSTISGGATRSVTTAATALNMPSYLARPEKPETETSSRPTRPQVVYATSDPDPDHQFLTGKAHIELRKMLPRIGAGLRHQPALLAGAPPL